MKTFFNVIVVILIVAFSYSALVKFDVISRNPCRSILTYSVGSLDGRFGISEEEFKSVIERSEKVWEGGAGRELFEYDENADFEINLVYDERQQQTIEEKHRRTELSYLESRYDNFEEEHSRELEEYQQKVLEYEIAVDSYESELRSFNQEVTKWNLRGGAPESVYNQLNNEAAELEIQVLSLEKMRLELNHFADELSSLGREGKQIAKEYNTKVGSYKDEFGTVREFSQGDYTGKGINIYQFDDKESLELVLSHELGHALTLSHVENPESVMYYLMDEQNLSQIELTTEDISALSQACGRAW
ncbi:MAG: hypothetical protein COV70_01920 [Parcubacteria group bacterium CG11_big_fil_rev_8_21_14_0_20_39_22]|nr:MAG: hypothetical protein COV70_01920 [Parcubacteria group bacterium CG11_big_fil_rev_8_21_14_0_20_39_22]